MNLNLVYVIIYVTRLTPPLPRLDGYGTMALEEDIQETQVHQHSTQEGRESDYCSRAACDGDDNPHVDNYKTCASGAQRAWTTHFTCGDCYVWQSDDMLNKGVNLVHDLELANVCMIANWKEGTGCRQSLCNSLFRYVRLLGG